MKLGESNSPCSLVHTWNSLVRLSITKLLKRLDWFDFEFVHLSTYVVKCYHWPGRCHCCWFLTALLLNYSDGFNKKIDLSLNEFLFGVVIAIFEYVHAYIRDILNIHIYKNTNAKISPELKVCEFLVGNVFVNEVAVSIKLYSPYFKHNVIIFPKQITIICRHCHCCGK